MMEKINDMLVYCVEKNIKEKKARSSLKDKVKRPQTLEDLAINKYYGKIKEGDFHGRI